ncbi:probable hexokinase-like 2 protein [Cucurbita moschata]|uniref:Phosphotransferase n=1 Tax=Cucurbita moschata TaxID=3662 RepID=A0A6J1GDJ2_CUCMO|nr:probable hexokinase-like 2 protein [Cucurbita moschata]
MPMRKEILVAALAATATLVVAAAALRRWKRRKQWQLKQAHRILRKFARDCATPVPKLWQIADDLESDMRASIASDGTRGKATLKMLVSYADAFPNGDEEGFYYGVNLRGTNFLILCARLGGKNAPISDIHREEISIPSNVMNGNSEDLFDFIAAEVAKFVSAHPENENEPVKRTELGFTLSYPVDDAAATLGNVIKWDSFSADDTVGKNMVKNINRALNKHGVNLRVSAMVDDTVGNLAGGRYYCRDSVAAITLGMGTNAAYIESAQELAHLNGPSRTSREMGISMEWGNFRSPHLPITEFDACLDSESLNPGSQVFQKLVSGTYLGEIVRRVLVKMAQETLLFGDPVPPKLMTPYLLRSPDMAAMHQDTSEDREVVNEKLKEIFGITDSTPMAREIVAEVCDVVSERAARLAGAGIVGIVKKLGRIENKRNIVTVEGGLYEHYRVFRNYLNSSIWEMLGNELSDNVIVEHSHGGSGAGAVFLASSQKENFDF